ncbi:MAG TPA: sodium:proton exchanger [Acidimicrobiia bacterium]|nr:sodium:proton exchanger [Acidimicrobiia bacterium]
MTTTDEDLHADVRPFRQRLSLILALAVTAPGVVLNLSGTSLAHPLAALLYGMAIVGSAFLLSWAAEVAQLDISAGLAIAVLAFIAVLPEYAVSLVFARDGGHGFAKWGTACQSPALVKSGEASPCSLALANMTGSNRLLIGLGWTLVVFIAWRQYRKRGTPVGGVTLERSHSVELGFLSVATAYSLTLPLKGTITLVDAAILITIFGAYMVRISKAPAEEPDLVGPAALIGTLSAARRRAAVLGLFVVAALIILACAEHFAGALVDTGRTFGVSEFLLVQWLAPLASEAPELLVAGLYAWRLNTSAGLGTLVSSKVNQWTLLIGTMPIAFALASGTLHGLPIVARQREELLLTAAQSLFAVATLCNLTLSVREAGFLFGLFWAQFLAGAFIAEHLHGLQLLAFSAAYLVLAARLVFRDRRALPSLVKDGFRTPYAELADDG